METQWSSSEESGRGERERRACWVLRAVGTLPARLSSSRGSGATRRHPEGAERPRDLGTLVHRGAVLALLLLGFTACLNTRRHYTAPSDAYRLNTFTVRDDSDRALKGECQRLITEKIPPTGEALIKVQVGSDGQVTRAEVTRSSGDARVDDIFGKLAARLQFDPVPSDDGTTARIRMGYSCGPGDAAVTTMSMMSGE